jgi:nitrogen regulatory protein PII
MNFKLILVIVENERTDAVLQAALTVGATGATILSTARGVGLSKALTFLGLELFSSRTIVLVEERRADQVLESVLTAGKLDETLGTGIALQISVDKAVGLSEHIKILQEKFPD